MTEWDGERYRQVSSLQQWLAARAVDGVDLHGVRDLLDVGCGDGRVTVALAERIPGARVVGIDPSAGMIAAAPRDVDVTFLLGDVLELDYRDDFDAVVSFNALHWVLDQPRALARIASALRPGGWALLVMVCAGARPSVEDIAMQVTDNGRWRSFFPDFRPPFLHPDPEEYRSLLSQSGFHVTDWDVADLAWDFGVTESFVAWCATGFGAWTQDLPAEVADRFVRDVVTAYEDVAGSPGRLRFQQLRAKGVRRPAAVGG